MWQDLLYLLIGLNAFSMNYFKQIAGLIILVFILAIFFVLFLSEQDDKRRAKLQTETAQKNNLIQTQFEQCLQDAEQKKHDAKQAGISQILAASRSGYFDSLKAECLSNQQIGIGDPEFVEIWDKKCTSDIEASFLKEEVIESDYIEAKQACNSRFGR